MKLHNARRMAPSEASKVFLDGNEDDYLTSNIFAADCKFATFQVSFTIKSKHLNSPIGIVVNSLS